MNYQLAILASQHQASDYNRLRFGQNGAPTQYLPLSLNFPIQYNQLCLRLAHAAKSQTTWVSSPAHPRSSRLLTPSAVHALALHIHQAAIDEPLAPLVKTSLSHPINITCLVPPDLLAIIASRAASATPLSPTLLLLSEKLFINNLVVAQSLTCAARPLHVPEDKSTRSTDAPPLGIAPSMEVLAQPTLPSRLSLGNIFMSSCPGKKVRLSDTDKPTTRSAVCRDLDMDMVRMKDLGVGCVVCCLDDTELQYLGAPWDLYVKSAERVGIDVLRIPIPEGLAPYSTAYLDTHLTRLMNEYTLKGTSVLVHCRGGVGRAGVIACCWVIKLGICGWVKAAAGPNGSGVDLRNRNDTQKEEDTAAFQNTLEFVERVICFVRRRRSLKAIETFEQVRFLVEYVFYLRGRGLRTSGEVV